MNKKRWDSQFKTASGFLKGAITYKSKIGEDLVKDVNIRDVSVSRYNGEVRILAKVDAGNIILDFKDTQNPPERSGIIYSEIERSDIPYGRGNKGDIHELINTESKVACTEFRAHLTGHNNEDISFIGRFDVDLT